MGQGGFKKNGKARLPKPKRPIMDGVKSVQTAELMEAALGEQERRVLKRLNEKGGRRDLLFPRMRLFARRYVLHGNAARAAREAGYSPKSAAIEGRWLLEREDVRELIAFYEQRRDQIFEDEVLNSLSTLVEIRDNPEIDPKLRIEVALEILDRAGYGKVERSEIKVEERNVQERIGVESSSMAESIRAVMEQIVSGALVR